MGFWSEVKDFGKEVGRWHEDALTLGQGWEAPADLVTGGAISQKEAAKEARRKQLAALSDAERIKQEGIDLAREEIGTLFPKAIETAGGGYQGALDMFSQSLPAQAQAFQGGNVAAQQQILAGLPMAQSAILGGQIDYSGLQPYQAQMPDMSMFNQVLPQVQAQRDHQAKLAEIQQGAASAIADRPNREQQQLNNWLGFARLLSGQAQQNPAQANISPLSGRYK